MTSNILQDFLSDVRIEAVKLQLQLSAPEPEQRKDNSIYKDKKVKIPKPKNDILGSIFNRDFDPIHLMSVIRSEIKIVESSTVDDLQKLYDDWNAKRVEIQFEGYGWGTTRSKRTAEAYAYVFLLRILKRYR